VVLESPVERPEVDEALVSMWGEAFEAGASLVYSEFAGYLTEQFRDLASLHGP
jgi:hypothetical protein